MSNSMKQAERRAQAKALDAKWHNSCKDYNVTVVRDSLERLKEIGKLRGSSDKK